MIKLKGTAKTAFSKKDIFLRQRRISNRKLPTEKTRPARRGQRDSEDEF